LSAAANLDLGTVNNLRAIIASGDSIDVRHVYLCEGLQQLFEIGLVACSRSADIDPARVLGLEASFSVTRGADTRTWTGLCTQLEQVEVDDSEGGLSTYQLTIAPRMWLLTQRRNHRMFKRLSEPKIALQILAEWGIEPEVLLDLGGYKARECRLQYAESDFAFVCRMLEDAGITYYFRVSTGETRLVLTDRPHAAPPREQPIPYVNAASGKLTQDYVTQVSTGRRARPGRYVQRDWDFRMAPGRAFTSSAEGGLPQEQRLERFHFVPNALHFIEGPGQGYPVGDDGGKFRRDEAEGDVQANKRLGAKLGQARTVSFSTGAPDLTPGTVFSIEGHPRADLGGPLLVTSVTCRGAATGEWMHEADAQPTDAPFVPPLTTPKPQVMGLEPATVVGPKGQEIHVDEFGRVKLHFHWDRESEFDDASSTWIPVSHAWSGPGYGHIDHPRIGQEVIVDFLCGDPDQPIVIGRLYTAQNPVPYPLPKNKTKSGWRSHSSPGGEGYNELMFEDRRGEELVRFQAELDYTALTKRDSGAVVGRDSMSYVDRDQAHAVMRDHTTRVGCHRKLRVSNQQSHWVDQDIYQESLTSTTLSRARRQMQHHSNEMQLLSVAEELQDKQLKRIVEQPIKSFITILLDKIIIESPHVAINPGAKALSPPPRPDPLSPAQKQDWYFFGGPESDGAAAQLQSSPPAPWPVPAPRAKKGDGRSVPAVRCMQFTSPEFRKRLVEMSDRLGIDEDTLATIMSYESGLNPATWNSIGYVGLIQFGPDTALRLGIGSDDLAKLSDVEQLEYVERYIKDLQRMRGADVFKRHPEDLYAGTFVPALVGTEAIPGTPAEWTENGKRFVCKRPVGGPCAPTSCTHTPEQGRAYCQNPSYDRDKKGYFTVDDVRETIKLHAAEAKGQRIDVDAPALRRPDDPKKACSTKRKRDSDDQAVCAAEARKARRDERARKEALAREERKKKQAEAVSKRSGNPGCSGGCKAPIK